VNLLNWSLKYDRISTKMKYKFPLEHVVKYDTKEVCVICDSAITAMGVSAIVEKFYPGYKGRIVSREFFEKLKNQSAN